MRSPRSQAACPARFAPADAPPAFFVVAHDDGRNPVEAAMLYLEYKRHGIPADLHVYAQGGHGFGMRRQPGRPVSDWPARTAEWMAGMGFAAVSPAGQP